MQTKIKKTLINTALVAAMITIPSLPAMAAKTDAANLAQCKSSIQAQIDSVNKIDIASVNSRRNLFRAKLRVKADGNRSLVLCEIRDQQAVAITCLKGRACDTSSIASQAN